MKRNLSGYCLDVGANNTIQLPDGVDQGAVFVMVIRVFPNSAIWA